jgi:hypothetical protein
MIVVKHRYRTFFPQKSLRFFRRKFIFDFFSLPAQFSLSIFPLSIHQIVKIGKPLLAVGVGENWKFSWYEFLMIRFLELEAQTRKRKQSIDLLLERFLQVQVGRMLIVSCLLQAKQGKSCKQ